MSQVLGEKSDWMAGLLEPLRSKSDDHARSASTKPMANGPAVANDLTSVRIQSLAGRGLIDPKSLRLREIQELSASIVAHIRQQHGK